MPKTKRQAEQLARKIFRELKLDKSWRYTVYYSCVGDRYEFDLLNDDKHVSCTYEESAGLFFCYHNKLNINTYSNNLNDALELMKIKIKAEADSVLNYANII